ncbi:MAG TPA: DUF3108 domain-containing protein, partial [Gammaproteobacteria bacterium]|nr:DUF3108 domain-containing protein [Gammaproteobacteria bacterium]
MLKLTTLLITVTLFSFNLYAARALPEFSARYAVQKFGMKVAEAHYKLKHTDSGYKYSEKTQVSGFASLFRDDTVTAVSYIDDIDGELLLRKHSHIQTGGEKNKNEKFSIQWDTSSKPIKGKITGTVRGKDIDLETDTPIWEILSFQVPLMIQASEDVKQYPYNAILKGKIDTYNFVLTSKKMITFADRQYKTLHIVRSDPDRDRQLHIWIAPELHNIPVIIENYHDGKEFSRIELE